MPAKYGLLIFFHVQLLKMLTSNCETPYLIWNNSTRAELSDFLEGMRKEQRHTTGETLVQNIDITFSSHVKELLIGNVFIRIYNSQPDFTIEVGVFIFYTFI